MRSAARQLDRPLPPLPPRPSIRSMRAAVQECRACDLWEGATQGVMGEGARSASLMLANVVKHFRYRARGKRRIHEQPDRRQVTAWMPWLEAELQLIRPDALVLLGATAAQALMGAFVSDLASVAGWLSER